MLSSNVTDATLGLIGFGWIRQAMARKAHHGFDMNIMYFNPSDVDEYVIQDLNAKRCNTLEELLSQADFVSLHCPAGAKTKHLINTETVTEELSPPEVESPQVTKSKIFNAVLAVLIEM